MDFVCKLYSNTYAVHVTVAQVGVATLNLALPAPPACCSDTLHTLIAAHYCASFSVRLLVALLALLSWM